MAESAIATRSDDGGAKYNRARIYLLKVRDTDFP